MKMKKIVALVTASALCLGMSMTVFADNSLTEADIADVEPSKDFTDSAIESEWQANTGYIGAESLTSPKGKFNTINEIYSRRYDEFVKANVGDDKPYPTEADIPAKIVEKIKQSAKDEYSKVVDTFADSDKVKEELEKNGYKMKDDATPTVVCAANLTLRKPVVDQNGNVTYEDITDPDDPALKEGIKQEFFLGHLGYNGLKADDTIVVLHYKADGTWEVIPATVRVAANGDVYAEATFTSLSPVAFVRMSNGDLVQVDPGTREPVKDENGNNVVISRPNANANANSSANANVKKATTVSTGKSPKTGEF